MNDRLRPFLATRRSSILGAGLRTIFEERVDAPLDAPVHPAVRLASKCYDTVSSLTISRCDDLTVSRTEEIKREKFYSMRLGALPSPKQDRLNAIPDKGAFDGR